MNSLKCELIYRSRAAKGLWFAHLGQRADWLFVKSDPVTHSFHLGVYIIYTLPLGGARSTISCGGGLPRGL